MQIQISDIVVDKPGETKQNQLISELYRIINTSLNEGDILPSVNVLSRELNISRDTVFKAYSELKQKNIVDSRPNKGYFVIRDLKKVLLVLDYYSPFKDIVYREIEKNLDPGYSIDLVFHHYNRELFDLVIMQSVGRYNSYIIMNPDTRNFHISDSLKKLDQSKLLLLDIPINDWKDFEHKKFSYVWQDFSESVFKSLESIIANISKYNEFHFINAGQILHPKSTLEAFQRFCRINEIDSFIHESTESIKIKKGIAYFVLRQGDLYNLLSRCRDENLEPGKDIGILAYNDIPLYEFVSCGITVMSTDFKEMGRKAAEFIQEKTTIQEIIPTRIILRNSL